MRNWKIVSKWSACGFSPSEPVFVPHPDAQNEDDGKLYSVSAIKYGQPEL